MERKVIFVFGSNLAGRHGRGSAYEAMNNYEAKYGIGVGLCGNSYAIPTKDEQLRVLSLNVIGTYVAEFLEFADEHRDWTFTIVAIGCGAAGYSPQDIAPMFRNAPQNCLLPKSFTELYKQPQRQLKLLHIGYRSFGAAETIEDLMRDSKCVLVDVRISRAALKYPYWSEENLRTLYSKRYVCAISLGNENRFKLGEHMKLVNEEKGLNFLMWLLVRDRIPILLCACADYQFCHRKMIIEKLLKIDTTIIIEQAKDISTTAYPNTSHCNQDNNRD